MAPDEKETKEKCTRLSVKNQLLIIIISTVILTGALTLTTVIKSSDSMFVGEVNIIDLTQMFGKFVPVDSDMQIDIAFILLSPTSLEKDKTEGVYLVERTQFSDCISCDSRKVPVKIEYESTWSFIIMTKLGLIDSAENGGMKFRPVETAKVTFHDGTEQTIQYDRDIAYIMSKYTLK